MRISGLYLKNWICFAGENELKLEAKMYSVVAQLNGQDGRSNGLGKTSFAGSIAFALFGRHPFRTEDEFVSRGEKSAEVRLELDDGGVVTRTRSLGKTTRHWYRVDGRDLYGPEAQDEIVRRVGLDEQDFCATCSFEQRQMARFVLCDPSERLSIVSGWLGLGPLELAEAEANVRAATLYAEADKITASIETTRVQERDAFGDYDQIAGGLEGKIASLEEKIAEARADLEQARAARIAAEEVEHALIDAGRYSELVVDGKQLASRFASLESELSGVDADGVARRLTAATGDLATARKEVEQRRVVASGRFDGRCPVAEIGCPATDQINAGREVAGQALQAARERHAAAEKVARDAGEEAGKLDRLRLDHRQVGAELNSARKVAVELRERAKKTRGVERSGIAEKVAAEEAARERVVEHERELAGFRQRLATVERARATRVRLAGERAVLDEKLAVHQAAVKIFGKNGAQRKLAEEALGRVEVLANDMLADAGIDLSMAVRWSREGKGLAAACHACGAPFPASARVKECLRCHEARGPKLVHALELLLSWRSGAGEDMGGMTFQLAASSWLRGVRGSAWSAAMLDEPSAQLDAAHRRQLLSAMTKMLSHAGFTQGFVIAHHPQIVDAMPGRLLVESDGKRSSIRVVT